MLFRVYNLISATRNRAMTKPVRFAVGKPAKSAPRKAAFAADTSFDFGHNAKKKGGGKKKKAPAGGGS